MTKMKFWLVLGLAGLLAGCPSETDSKADGATSDSDGADKGPKKEDKKVDITVDDETKTLAEELAKKLKDGKFPHAEQRKKENAKAFVYLASLVDDKAVTAAALYAMKESHASKDVDDDYNKIVLARLASPTDAIVGGALRASVRATRDDGKNDKVIQAVIDVIAKHPNPVARYEAMNECVGNIDKHYENANLVTALLANADSKEDLVAVAATRGFSSFVKPSRDKVLAKLQALVKHDNPAVRGQAVKRLTGLTQHKPEEKKVTVELILPLLDDKSPFVKSVTAYSLGELNVTKALDKIFALMSDNTNNVHSIKYKTLAGEGRIDVNDGSNYSRVDDAMIWTIRAYAYHTDDKFKPGERQRGMTVDQWVEREVKAAKAWYDKNKDKL